MSEDLREENNNEQAQPEEAEVPMQALYKLCYGGTPRELEQQVTPLINRGWRPLGGAGIGDLNKTKCFVQALLAVEPVPEAELEKLEEEAAAGVEAE
jgi:hypothetical protein